MAEDGKFSQVKSSQLARSPENFVFDTTLGPLRQDLALWPAARHTSVDEFPGESQCARPRSKSAPSKAESASRARAQRELARQQ